MVGLKSLVLAVLIVLFVFASGEEAQKESAQVDDLFAIKPGENFTVSDLNLTMIWVVPGTFTMGIHRYGTERNVTLTEGFWLGKGRGAFGKIFLRGSRGGGGLVFDVVAIYLQQCIRAW